MKIAAFVMSILAILVSSVTLFSCLDKKKAWKRSEMQGQKMLWLLVFIAVVILIPILLNYIISRPAVIEIVGDETDWLAFHGSYIGAIVGAGISFLIMYLTLNYYKKEDKYKHEVEWLNEFRKICVDYVSAFNIHNVKVIINQMTIDPNKANEQCKSYLNQLITEESKMAMFVGETKDDNLASLFKELQVFQGKYRSMYSDVMIIVFRYYHASQRIQIGGNCITKEELIYSVSEGFVKHINTSCGIKQSITIDELYGVLCDWANKINKAQEDISEACKQYITAKSKEIESIRQ